MFEILEYLGLALIAGFILLDLVWRSRRFDTPRFWRLRALAVSIFNVGLSIAVAIFWSQIFADFSLLNGATLGPWGGAIVGILVYEFVHYWYHRSIHRFDALWLHLHQMHHSAESLDAFGANYLHPFDLILFASWSSLVLFPVLGLSAEAGVLASVFLVFNAMFQHANIRTPHWLGYILQRPESHGIHHMRGMHRYNYSDLPVWDMVFGTFRNPETWEGETGFYNGASARIGEMLIGRDVSVPPTEEERPIAAGCRSYEEACRRASP